MKKVKLYKIKKLIIKSNSLKIFKYTKKNKN